MRERPRDSERWRSSPSRSRDLDRSNLVRSDRRDASSQCGRSPGRSDWDSRRLDVRRADWEAGIGGIRREYGDSDPYEVERRKRDGLSKREREEERDDERRRKLSRFQMDAFAGEVYPDRCESVRTEEKFRNGFRGAVRSEEELYRIHEAERSREVDNFVRSTLKQCWKDDPEPSRSISSHGYSNSVSPVRNVLRNDEVDRLGSSGSRNYNDLERLRIQPYRSSEHERTEAVFVAMNRERDKQCCEDGRVRDCYIPTSRMSCVGSNSAETQQDNSRRVSLNSIGGNDPDIYHRMDDINAGGIGNRCASQVLRTRDLDRYVDRISSRGFQEDEKAKSFLGFDYPHSHNSCCCVSSTASKWSKAAGASRESYNRGCCSSVSDIAVKEFYGDSHRMHMAREPDRYMHMRRHLPKSGVTDSLINKVDGAGTIVDFQTRERISDQYDHVRELDNRVEEARLYREVHYDEDAYLDNKTQQLRKDYQFDIHATMCPDVCELDMIDQDERPLQFRRVCRNRGKETYLDNGSQQVQKDYEFDSYARMYSDANRSDVMIDRDGTAPQFRRVCRKNHDESQQVRKYYEFDSYARIYPDVNGSDVMVDQDERALQFRRMCFNKEKEAYLENGSQQLQKDYESDSYARMYPKVREPSPLMGNRDEETQYRRHHLEGGHPAYLDNESVQLGNTDQIHLHAGRDQLDDRREVYSNVETLHTGVNYRLQSHMLGELGEVVYESTAEVNYGDVTQSGMTYEKPESGRFQDHGVAYEYMDGQYKEELTSSEQIRRLVDERSFGHDDQYHVSSSCPRIPVKERLGGRVKDYSTHVKRRLGPGKEGLPWVKNAIPNGKSHGKNQKIKSKAQRSQWGHSSRF